MIDPFPNGKNIIELVKTFVGAFLIINLKNYFLIYGLTTKKVFIYMWWHKIHI